MKKRGQVTIFFIVGAVILILIIGYFAINALLKEDTVVTENIELPEQVRGVNTYIQSCVEGAARNGLDLISTGGGYISLQEERIPLSGFNPIGKNLEIFPQSGYKVAVWYRQTGNGLDEVNMPSIGNMEGELADYINIKFLDCLANLTGFMLQGYEITSNQTNVKTKVNIYEDSVLVRVEYPIDITNEGVSYTIKNYNVEINSKLGRLYKIAREAFEKENRELLLENKTLDMMIAYDPEIPYAGTDQSCAPRIWSKYNVTQRIQEALFNNIGATKIKGTNYEIPDKRFEYLELDMLDNSYSDVSINLMYSLSWPLLVDITPAQGDILKGSSMVEGGSWYMGIVNRIIGCLSTHHFVYNIKYPILITIQAENGEIFQFATEVVIDHNQPRKSVAIIESYDNEASPVCDYLNAPISISSYTYAINGDYVPLGGVNYSFKCHPAVCNVGEVQSTEGMLMAPPCFNGILVGNKEGYYNGKTIVSSVSGSVREAIVNLEKIYNKQVQVYVVDKKDGIVREPYDSESVLFEFRNLDNDYNVYYSYPPENNSQNTIDLIAGRYRIHSQIFADSTWPITTQKQSINYCMDVADAGVLGILGISKDKKCVKYDIPSMEVDYAIKGEDLFEYEFKREDLSNPNSLKLYVLAGAVPSDYEEMAEVGSSPDLSSKDPNFRYPEI